MSQSESDDPVYHGKDQKISKGNSGLFNSPKKQQQISTLASKKWLNQKNKGTLLRQIGPNYYNKMPT